MKTKFYLLPVVALILAGVWTANPRREISTLEEANAALQKQIAGALSSGPDINLTHATPNVSAGVAKDKEPLDWKKLIGQFAEMNRKDGADGQRAMDRLEQCVETMSKEELVAALEDIAALDPLEGFGSTLDDLIMKSLLAKDVEIGLTYYADRLYKDICRGTLASSKDKNFCGGTRLFCEGLQEWAEKDPAKATAWLDRQIAAGKLDSKSLDGEGGARNSAEGTLIYMLLGKSPAVAARRLAAIPPELRAKVIDEGLMRNPDEDEMALTTLIRSQVPEKDQAELLANRVLRVVHSGGYAKVDEYMDRISASPAERRLCVERAAESNFLYSSMQGGINEKSLNILREWTMAQAPDSTDRITGKALARSLLMHDGDKQKFAEASEWILGYHRASGKDELITSFLAGFFDSQNKDQARALAAQIIDPKAREDAFERLNSIR